MPLRRFFRLLVVASLVVPLLAVGYHTLAQPHISEDWQSVLAWSGNGGWLPDVEDDASIPKVIGVLSGLAIFLVFTIAMTVGLFRFWRWARLAAVVLTAAYWIAAPAFGLVVSLPYEAALYELAMMIEGAILALAYFSPLRREFARSPI